MSWLIKLLYFVFPIIELKKAEKKILKDDAENEIDIDYSKSDKSIIEKIYNDTFEIKKLIDDKAKTGIIGVTITVGLISSISTNFENLSFVSILLYIIALVYSFISGYLSLTLLSNKNIIYKLKTDDAFLEENELKEAMIINTKLNIKHNVNRQNYVYSSYRHLIYSLVIMVFAFLLNICFSQKSTEKNQNINVQLDNLEKNYKELTLEINKMKFKYEVITEQNEIQIQQIKCLNNKLENIESKNEEKKEILK
ncbi:hypothetical protein L5F33_07645 [Aliarcobacter butzleri]|uniref:hypothetical protein n=1 Tax=Aliarcobacter butzleri TaxID=28197 RepID=UPI001EDD7796|nr:hypothetical protein [Aliarcobacter butzleri]MCG3670129.1 hypothetical protein [Aliarcobacter butzleri]